MNVTKIISIITFVIAIALGFYLFKSIQSTILEAKKIEKEETRVINKLKLIRKAMTAYQKVNGQYTSDWDKLVHFVDSGKFYVIERKEQIIQRQYGGDSVIVHLDTLGSVPVKDSLFSNYSYAQLAKLPYKPNSDTKFNIYANKITKAGVDVDVFEVEDPDPINPARQKGGKKKPLKIGSKNEVTTAGNWE